MELYRHLGLPFTNIERPTEHERAAIRLLNYAQSKNDAKLWVSIATSYTMFGILGSRAINHPSTWTSAGLNNIFFQSEMSEEFRNEVQPLVFQMNNRLETLGGIYPNGKTFDFLDCTPRLFALMEELGIEIHRGTGIFEKQASGDAATNFYLNGTIPPLFATANYTRELLDDANDTVVYHPADYMVDQMIARQRFHLEAQLTMNITDPYVWAHMTASRFIALTIWYDREISHPEVIGFLDRILDKLEQFPKAESIFDDYLKGLSKDIDEPRLVENKLRAMLNRWKLVESNLFRAADRIVQDAITASLCNNPISV